MPCNKSSSISILEVMACVLEDNTYFALLELLSKTTNTHHIHVALSKKPDVRCLSSQENEEITTKNDEPAWIIPKAKTLIPLTETILTHECCQCSCLFLRTEKERGGEGRRGEGERDWWKDLEPLSLRMLPKSESASSTSNCSISSSRMRCICKRSKRSRSSLGDVGENLEPIICSTISSTPFPKTPSLPSSMAFLLFYNTQKSKKPKVFSNSFEFFSQLLWHPGFLATTYISCTHRQPKKIPFHRLDALWLVHLACLLWTEWLFPVLGGHKKLHQSTPPGIRAALGARIHGSQTKNTPFRCMTAVLKSWKGQITTPKTLRFFHETWQFFEGFEVTGTGGSSLILIFPNTRRRWSHSQVSEEKPKASVDLIYRIPCPALAVASAGQVSKFHSESGRVFSRFYSQKPRRQISATKTNLQLKGPMTRKNRPIWELVDLISTQAWTSVKIF